jgi:hypothetical protein
MVHIEPLVEQLRAEGDSEANGNAGAFYWAETARDGMCSISHFICPI